MQLIQILVDAPDIKQNTALTFKKATPGLFTRAMKSLPGDVGQQR
jgi:hypothetical protein